MVRGDVVYVVVIPFYCFKKIIHLFKSYLNTFQIFYRNNSEKNSIHSKRKRRVFSYDMYSATGCDKKKKNLNIQKPCLNSMNPDFFPI